MVLRDVKSNLDEDRRLQERCKSHIALHHGNRESVQLRC